jgi:cytochrome b
VLIEEISMNRTSESRAEVPTESRAASGPARKVLIWDAPVRVFHWLMAFSFVGAYLTAESERWRLVHVTLGYTMAGLVGFRIVWGLLGTRHARFSDFVRGPAAVVSYFGGMLRGQRQHHVGHNPAGALAVVALLGLTLAMAASGWAVFSDASGDWLEEVHEFAAHAMLAVVGIHIAGVLLASRVGHENLIGAMITGRKVGRPEDGVRSARRGAAILMLAAVLGFWWLQWQMAPAAAGMAGQAAAGTAAHSDRGDD